MAVGFVSNCLHNSACCSAVMLGDCPGAFLGSRSSSAFRRLLATHRLTVASPTLKVSATWAAELPRSTAATTRLRRSTEYAFIPHSLPDGSMPLPIGVVRGSGFILSEEQAQGFIERDPRNRDVIFPYLTGQDINGHVKQAPSRWVINFFDWDEDRAAGYPELLQIVRDKVLPERAKVVHESSRKKLTTYYWRYDALGKELYRTIAGMQRVMARSRVSELHMIAFVGTGMIYSDAAVVFAYDDYYHFGILQSALHEAWIRHNASTMRTDIRYTPSDCFDTFPFPDRRLDNQILYQEAASAGRQYENHRAELLLNRSLGLTKAYNIYHDSECTAPDIVAFRELHAVMDRATLACYKWTDIELEHDFYNTDRGTRFTISEAARREILDRLLQFNHELYAEEVAQGLHDRGNGARGTRRGRGAATTAQTALAGFGLERE